MSERMRPNEMSVEGRHAGTYLHKGQRRMRLACAVQLPGHASPTRFSVTCKLDDRVREGGRAWTRLEDGLRRKAKAKAEAMLLRAHDEQVASERAEADGRRVWSATDLVSDYLAEVSLPALEATTRLRDSSKALYRGQMRRLASIIPSGMTLGEIARPRALERVLRDTATEMGTSSAKHVRGLLNEYLFSEMVKDELIDATPLTPSFRPELPQVSHATSRRAAAGLSGVVVALAPDERARVIECLLAMDCDATSRSGGGVTREQAAWRRRELVDVTLLQATCGLRISECLLLRREDVSFDGTSGLAVLDVRPERSKTHRGRRVPMFDPVWGGAVSERLAEDVGRTPAGGCVFGSCKVPGRAWDRKNARRDLRALYDELADALGIPTLRDAFTHVWRATLNAEYRGRMGEGMRADLFGHTEDVNERYYTAGWTTEEILDAARR